MGYRKEDSGQGSIPEFGAIFMSNSATRKECFERQLLGLPSGKGSFVKQIKSGMALFLFEFEKRELHGVFRASSDGAMNIVPNAFSSSGMQFPAQVRFTRTWHCSPLREHEFRVAIKENYFAKYKFNFGLSFDQVRSLLELFKLRRLESKLPRQPVIREDRDRLIGENKRVPSTNLGTTDDSRLLKIDARENRREYDAAMEHSRTSFHNRKRYHDDIEHDHDNKRVPSTNFGTTDDSRLLKIVARENKREYGAAMEHSRTSFHNRKRYHDDIEHDHDMNHGVGCSVIHDTENMNRPGREGDGSQYAFAREYPEDFVSEVRRAGQDGSYLTRNVIEEDKHYAASGCGFAARPGFENTGDEARRTTNDGCRYPVDHRTESNHNLDDVPEPYYPADYHGSPLLGDNGTGYPVNPLEKLRKIHHDDRFLFSDRVETVGDQFVGQPDVEWSASGRGKSWGNVYSEMDPRVERGFEDETSTLYAGFTFEEARNLRTEGILPRSVGYNVKNSPRSNLPVVDYPRENPPFCSSNTISQTEFSFGPYQSKPCPGLLFSHSTSYDTLATKPGPYEPKILDIHHRRSPHVDNSLLQPAQKYSPHHSFIESPHLTKMTKKTSPYHLEAEETGRHMHLGDTRGSYGPEAQDVYSKHSSYGNNSLVQNYPPSCENYLTSLGRRTSPSLIQDEDASQHHQVTGGPYDPEILGGCGKYSSYVGGNSIHQQQQQQQDFFPLHVSSIASNIVSSKEQLPGDTFHQFQSCHKPGDYNSSGRTSNLLFGTECYYANRDPKSSSFGQFGDLLSSGPPVSMPSTTSAGVNDYKNIHHEEGSQMSGFKDAASAAKGDSYLHRNLSSEPPRKHNGKYNQSFKESSCAPRRRTEIDQTSSRTSVFDRLTSGSKPRASDADSSDADASVDQIMDALYQNLNHPVTKKAKISSVVGQQKKELPWVAKHVKTHSEVFSDKPETTATEMKNESKQVIVDGDGDGDSDDQIRKDTRVVEFNRRRKKKIEESPNPKICVQNAEIGASSSVQQVQQENESSGGKVVVNRRRKLLRPTFGKKEQSNDELTNNGNSNLQLTSPPNNLGKICKEENHPSSSSLDQSTPPTSKSNAPPNEAAQGDVVRETISEPLGSVSERKELLAAEDAANGDQHYRKNGQIRRPKFTTVKEHNNTGSSEKDGFQSTILQYSSSRVEDKDSYINDENNGSSGKDGFPQSVAGETSYKNADCLDCRNSSNLVDDKAPVMIKTEN